MSLGSLIQPASAQVPQGPIESPSPTTVLGVHAGMGGSTHGLAFQLKLWLSEPIGEFLFRSASTSETLDIAGFPPISGDVTKRVVSDYAFLYGRRAASSRAWVRASVGAAIVRSDLVEDSCIGFLIVWACESTTQQSRTTIGAAGQMDAAVRLGENTALELTALGNLNGEVSFAALTLGLSLFLFW